MKKSTKLIIGILSVIAIICVTAVLVFAGNGKEKSEYDKRLTASQKYLDELNYEQAIAELELAIEIEPNNAEAYIALAEVYAEMGYYEFAVKVLKEAKGKVDDKIEIDKQFTKLKEQNIVEDEVDDTNSRDIDSNDFETQIVDKNDIGVDEEDINEITVKIHYSRDGGDYEGWNLWGWLVEKQDVSAGAQYDFVEENGEMVATIEKIPGRTTLMLGYLVRLNEWEAKDYDTDQFIELMDIVSGTVHYYIHSGTYGGTRVLDSDVVVVD